MCCPPGLSHQVLKSTDEEEEVIDWIPEPITFGNDGLKAGDIKADEVKADGKNYFDWEALDGIYAVEDKSEKVKITIDSGASDSVCPKDWAPVFTTVACEPGKAK